MPNAQSVVDVSYETGISQSALYRWKSDDQGMTGKASTCSDAKDPERWDGQQKLAIIIETAGLNEHECSGYCREKGLYVEQIARWRAQAAEGCNRRGSSSALQRQELRQLKQQAREAEKEIWYKEKALAETVALLVLKKSPGTLGGQRGCLIPPDLSSLAGSAAMPGDPDRSTPVGSQSTGKSSHSS